MLRPVGSAIVWDQLAIAISPDRVVVSAEGAALLVQIIDLYERRQGIPYTPTVRDVRSVLAAAAANSGHARTPQRGHTDVRQTTAAPAWADDEIGTREAAELIGCSREHAGRLAREGVLGRSRRAGNRRLVSRAEVLAFTAVTAARRSRYDEGLDKRTE